MAPEASGAAPEIPNGCARSWLVLQSITAHKLQNQLCVFHYLSMKHTPAIHRAYSADSVILQC